MSRPSFSAVSTASEPDEVRKTRAPGTGARSATRAQNCSAGSFVNMSKQWYASRRAHLLGDPASTISGRPWPTVQYQRLAMAST